MWPGPSKRVSVGTEADSACLKHFIKAGRKIGVGKGASFEAAPNELFYSFHEDEISATALLHPCKVAFLQKGEELPCSVSSFVCRRVYDTANKCLYWLTDQDYTDEHQAEVDDLLDRTKHEMQGTSAEGPSQRATSSPPFSETGDSESVCFNARKR
ncbi:hypothetical protein L7F22_024553 [Adiantum nelumboides]|nr:hypothetical protein [Adiantum nelumboides]